MKEASIRNLVSWGMSLIAAWSFIHQGWLKISPHEEAAAEYAIKFQEWGYEPEFATRIAIVEILVGIFVIYPRTSSIAASVGSVLMIGAIYTHLSTGIGSPAFAIILLLICLCLTVLRWPESIIRRLFAKK
jgi:uncharacterized membrane protein YphA (DoxX/SURF4 family)